jgi:integrase
VAPAGRTTTTTIQPLARGIVLTTSPVGAEACAGPASQAIRLPRPNIAAVVPVPAPATVPSAMPPTAYGMAPVVATDALAAALTQALPSGGDFTAVAAAVKALAFALSARESSRTGGNSPAGLSDTGIGDDADGVSNPKGHDAMKIFGPYPYKKRWRILIRLGSGQEARSFETEAEAKAELRKLRIEAHRQAGIPCEKAIDTYADLLRTNGLRESSIDTTTYRLKRFFDPVLKSPLATITPARARDLFTRLGGSVDSRRNTLAEAKTFARKAKENGWNDTVLLADVRGEGRRRYGKTKLTLDESRKFLAACLELAGSAAAKKRTAGIASAMPLIFGMRASEITGLQVRDLDAGGTIIRIRRAKTQAGIRSLQVPDWFRPFLAALAAGKAPTDLLIGRERTWLHRNVRSICQRAKVTEAPPHGLRGTHGDLALTAAVAPKAVSEALGHESLTTTYRHYADAGITQAIDHGRALETLAPASPMPN